MVLTRSAPETKLKAMEKRAYSGRGLALLFAAVFIISAAYLVLIGLFPRTLGATGEYEWPVLFHGVVKRLPAALLITLLGVCLAALFFRDAPAIAGRRAGKARILLALFLLGAALQAGPAAVHKQGLLEYSLRVYLPDHNSYFADAARIRDPRQWLDHYLARFEKLSAILDKVKAGQQSGRDVRGLWREADAIFHTHTRTHPPGAVLAFYAAQELAGSSPGFTRFYVQAVPRSREAAGEFGISASEVTAGGLCALVLFLTAAASVPLAFVLARLFLSDQKAVLAAALFATAPAFSHKTPVLDHCLAFVVLFCLWLFMSGLFSSKWWKPVVAGVIAGPAMWMGTSVIALFPLCAVFAAAWLVKSANGDRASKEGSWKGRAVHALVFIAVLSGTAAVVCLSAGTALDLSYIKVYKAVSRVGWNLNNLASQRQNVSLWIAFNFYEMIAFAGVPLAVFFIASAASSLVSVFKRQAATGAVPWVLAIAVFMLALNLSGKVCYEASRLAWFCFPLMAIAAAEKIPAHSTDIHNEEQKPATLFIAGLLALQAACAIVFRMIY